ncbi:FkbM family methyltransferase [Nocardioides limicola]|uniref:FkbM family methyltransferase n=1 Tax=Nocardioides limicola TaxID=2803368 RepID=UPI00193B08BD|nr:FkbM family methyltransferase [Nocardioides sp. DJM-14]
MIRNPSFAMHRLRQTGRFRNAPQVLWSIATSRTPLRRDALRFVMKDGTVIDTPNQPGARVPIYEVFVEDAYDYDALTEGLRPDLVALDIGGHVGCFSVALAKHSREARVHTYEASPVTAQWLFRNVEQNELSDRVHPHHSAVAGVTGTLEFADNGRGSGLNGVTAAQRSGHPTAIATVPAVTFGDAVRAAGGTVDLVKMDTEGAEYDIVLNSSAEDWETVSRIVLEHHAVPGQDAAELERFLVGAGFEVTRRESGGTAGILWLDRR